MFRTKASVAICGVLGVLALLFYVDSRFAAQALGGGLCIGRCPSPTKIAELQKQLQDTLVDTQAEALKDRTKIAELQKQVQDASDEEDCVRPAQQSSIDYQSLWSAAHCTDPAVAQSLTPEQVANTTRIEEMLGPPGILVPYEVRVTAEKGRGLFATQPISKGTMIVSASREIRFDTSEEWDAFVACIPDEKLKSDVAHWAWEDKEKKATMLALDDSSLVNNCDTPTMGPHWSDLVPDNDLIDTPGALQMHIRRLWIPSDRNTFARRDIEPGEELCDKYSAYNAEVSNDEANTRW